MIQHVAQWILRDKIAYYENSLEELSAMVDEKEETIDRLQGVLDTVQETFTFGSAVHSSRDLPFTPDEKQWLKDQGEMQMLPKILDKLLMNVLAGLAKQPHPATKEDALRIQNIRLAFLLLQSEALEAAGKKVMVDPLTTEVTQK